MYPTINLAGGFTNPTKPPLESRYSDDPSKEPLSTTLRVVVGERFRVAPPVLPPSDPSLLNLSSTSQTTTSCDYERDILKQLAGNPINQQPLATSNLAFLLNYTGEQSAVAGPSQKQDKIDDPASMLLTPQDKFEALISQCMSSGFSREHASLGLAVALTLHGASRVTSPAVLDAAKKVRTLCEMGFSKRAATGALVAKNGDLQAAVDMAAI